MKDLACTGVLAGQQHVMRLDHLLYVCSSFYYHPLNLFPHLLIRALTTAVRWFRIRQGIHLRAGRLQRGNLGSELCGLDLRRQRISNRVGTARRDQDPNPEPQLREPGVWRTHCG